MHIGLIGGIGPAAAEFSYRGLIDRHVASGRVLDLTIAHADVRERSRNLANRDPRMQAEIFAEVAAAIGERIGPGHLLSITPLRDARAETIYLSTNGISYRRITLQHSKVSD
jgi:hypothetical protein